MFLPTIMGSSPRPSFADSTRVFSLFSFSRRPATSLATSSPCESRSPFRVRRSSPLWSISRICRLSSVARFLRMCTSRTCLVVASMRGGPAKVTPSKWCSSPVCWSSASSRPRRMTRLSISMLRFLDSSVSAAYSSSLRPTSARWKCMSLTSSSYDVCAVAEKRSTSVSSTPGSSPPAALMNSPGSIGVPKMPSDSPSTYCVSLDKAGP
mmetsp:Transcript_42934/g.115620  ORF Transcript_42934/g.115620 Transcript_42934/m.115620 type:complete len:209 (-) Transcript_42934:1193-1819(-)